MPANGHHEGFSSVVEAELSTSGASLQILRHTLPCRIDTVLRHDDCYRLDLSLTQRLVNTELCFADHWSPQRYERPGRLFLLPPGENLRVRSGVGQQDALICHLPKRALPARRDTRPVWTDRRLEANLNIECRTVGAILLQLCEEVRNPGLSSEMLCEALAVQLAVALQRYLADEEPVLSGGLPAWRLRLIEQRLNDDPVAPSLEELAQLCRLSVRHLTRAFQESRGISIGSHIAANRANRAKDLLSSGEAVKQVAFAMGFASSSSFVQAFRKSTGMTPGWYQREVTGRA